MSSAASSWSRKRRYGESQAEVDPHNSSRPHLNQSQSQSQSQNQNQNQSHGTTVTGTGDDFPLSAPSPTKRARTEAATPPPQLQPLQPPQSRPEPNPRRSPSFMSLREINRRLELQRDMQASTTRMLTQLREGLAGNHRPSRLYNPNEPAQRRTDVSAYASLSFSPMPAAPSATLEPPKNNDSFLKNMLDPHVYPYYRFASGRVAGTATAASAVAAAATNHVGGSEEENSPKDDLPVCKENDHIAPHTPRQNGPETNLQDFGSEDSVTLQGSPVESEPREEEEEEEEEEGEEEEDDRTQMFPLRQFSVTPPRHIGYYPSSLSIGTNPPNNTPRAGPRLAEGLLNRRPFFSINVGRGYNANPVTADGAVARTEHRESTSQSQNDAGDSEIRDGGQGRYDERVQEPGSVIDGSDDDEDEDAGVDDDYEDKDEEEEEEEEEDGEYEVDEEYEKEAKESNESNKAEEPQKNDDNNNNNNRPERNNNPTRNTVHHSSFRGLPSHGPYGGYPANLPYNHYPRMQFGDNAYGHPNAASQLPSQQQQPSYLSYPPTVAPSLAPAVYGWPTTPTTTNSGHLPPYPPWIPPGATYPFPSVPPRAPAPAPAPALSRGPCRIHCHCPCILHYKENHLAAALEDTTRCRRPNNGCPCMRCKERRS